MKRFFKIVVLLFMVLTIAGNFAGINNNEAAALGVDTLTFDQFSNSVQDLINTYDDNLNEPEFNLSYQLTMVNDTLMVKAEEFSDVTGVEVKRVNDVVSIKSAGISVDAQLNSAVLIIGGEEVVASEPIQEINGDIYLPVEDIAEVLGYTTKLNAGHLKLQRPYLTKRIILKSYSDVDNYGAVATIEGYQGIHVFQYATEEETKNAVSEYEKDENIIWFQVDNIVSVEDVEVQGAQDSFSYKTWGASSVGAERFSNYLINSIGVSNLPEIIVAVLDTGIDTDHSWFTNRIASGGVNYSSSSSSTSYAYEDAHGHGTHVSGTIVDLTLANVKILPVKVMSNSGTGSSLQIQLGMNYVLNKKNDGANIRVMNMSIGSSGIYVGSSDYTMYTDAITNCYNAGIMSCVAAGNESEDVEAFSPANVSNALTISAVGYTSSGKFYRPNWSNYGEYIDVAAPGVSIESAGVGGGTATMNGTSMATPHVSAVVALLMSDTLHNYSLSQIENLIKSTAIDLGETGWDKFYGQGLVNIEYAGVDQISDVAFSDTTFSHTQSFSLTLSCSTLGAKIYYTTDGKLPTTSSNLYSSSISISTSTKIRAIAFTTSGTTITGASKIKTQVFQFDGSDVADAFIVTSDGELLIYNGIAENVTVPSSVSGITITSIASNAFSFSSVKNVTLPSTVTTIKEDAFSNCTTLETCTGANVTAIKGSAFENCFQLKSINFPEATMICSNAFNGCALQSLTLNKAVYIGNNAFAGNKLTSVTLPKAEFIANGCFSDNDELVEISVPQVKIIGVKAFANCVKIESIALPNVEEIWQEAFLNCVKLEEVNMSNVKYIYNKAFKDCEALTEVELKNVFYVGIQAFANCENITKITLSPTIEQISDDSFEDLTCELYYYSGTIVDNLVSTKSFQFILLNNEEQFTYTIASGEVTITGLASGVTDTVVIPSYIDNKPITKIADNAFENSALILALNLSNVTEIGSNAFKGCTNLMTVYLPNIVTIKSNAFQGCASLSCVQIENASTLGEKAFFGCTTLLSVELGNNITTIESKALGYKNDLLRVSGFVINGREGTVAETYANSNYLTFVSVFGELTKYYFSSVSSTEIAIAQVGGDVKGRLTIPSEYNSKTIVSILEEAFKDCCFITEIKLPSTIKTIGKGAFVNCSMLESINLDYVTTLEEDTTIGGAFEGCGLKTVTLSLVSSIPSNTFKNCTRLTEVIAPNVTEIRANAFNGCEMLKTANMPNVENIYESAFAYCYSLENITVENVKVLGTISGFTVTTGQVFNYCTSLKKMFLPSIVKLGSEVFDNSGITRVLIGKNLLAYQSNSINPSIRIYGYAGYLAQTYANTYGNEFVAITEFAISNNLPVTLNVDVTDECVLTIGVSGVDETYQWYQTDSTIDAGTKLIGQTSNTLTINTSLESNDKYFVKITNYDGAVLTSNICNVIITLRTYTISASAEGNGLISPSGNVGVNKRNNRLFTFIPDEGYGVKEIYIDGNKLTGDDLDYAINNGYTFESVTESHSIAVTFAQNSYFIEITQAENGTIEGSELVSIGDDITFTITPSVGYSIQAIIVDGNQILTGVLTSYTFEDVCENHTITAIFVARSNIKYKVKHYSQSLTSTGDVFYGGKLYNIIEIETKTGTTNTQTSATAKTYDGFTNLEISQTNINGDGSGIVNIYYDRISYNLTLTKGEGISQVNGAGNYLFGEDVNISAVLNEGYNWSIWANGEETYISTQNATISMPSSNLTLIARANIKTFTIQCVNSLGGNAPATTMVNYAENKTIEFTPNAHYHVSSLIIDGVTVEPSASYTFLAVKENHTVNVSFAQTTFVITLNVDNTIQVSYDGGLEVVEGTSKTFTLAPIDYFEVDNVKVNGVNVKLENNSFTVENINSDLVIDIKGIQSNTKTGNSKTDIWFEVALISGIINLVLLVVLIARIKAKGNSPKNDDTTDVPKRKKKRNSKNVKIENVGLQNERNEITTNVNVLAKENINNNNAKNQEVKQEIFDNDNANKTQNIVEELNGKSVNDSIKQDKYKNADTNANIDVKRTLLKNSNNPINKNKANDKLSFDDYLKQSDSLFKAKSKYYPFDSVE